MRNGVFVSGAERRRSHAEAQRRGGPGLRRLVVDSVSVFQLLGTGYRVRGTEYTVRATETLSYRFRTETPDYRLSPLCALWHEAQLAALVSCLSASGSPF